MGRLSPADWLGRLRAKGWTRSQIQAATGASPSTQQRLQSGKQKSTRYEDAIRTAGSKYSRRATVPPEYPHTPKPHLSLPKLLAQLSAVDLAPDEGEVEDLTEQFGSTGMRAILKGQLDANRRYQRDGIRTRLPGDPNSWFQQQGPEMMRRFNKDGLIDPIQFIRQLWYVGIKP